MSANQNQEPQLPLKIKIHQIFTGIGAVAMSVTTGILTYGNTASSLGVPVSEGVFEAGIIASGVTGVCFLIVYLTRPVAVRVVGTIEEEVLR